MRLFRQRFRQRRNDTPVIGSPVSVSPCTSPEPEAEEEAEVVNTDAVVDPSVAELIVGAPVQIVPPIMNGQALLVTNERPPRNPAAVPHLAAGILRLLAEDASEEPVLEPEAAIDARDRAAAMAAPESPFNIPRDSDVE